MACGGAGGYAGGFASGYIMSGGDVNAALSAAKSGALTGTGIGGVTGGVAGYKYAKDNGIDPWGGKFNKSVTIGEGMVDRVDPASIDFGNESISEVWPKDLPAYKNNQVNPDGISFNKGYVEVRMKSNYTFLDIGLIGNTINSPYYNMEVQTLQNYPNVYRVIKIETVQTLRIYYYYKK